MKNKELSFKEDKYARLGKYSSIIDIYCRKCDNHICYYQKDGGTKNYIGQLRRVYFNRFLDNNPKRKILACKKCKEILGTKIFYEKTSRNAFRLYVGAVKHKLIKTKKIKIV